MRPWQYVLDVLWGYLTLGKDLSSGDLKGDTAFNFGPAPDGFQTVGRVAELLAAHFLGARYERQSGCCSGETEILRLDSEKARRILGWRPQYTLEEALAQTAAFYKKMQEVPAAQLCREQAEQYIERVRSRVKLS